MCQTQPADRSGRLELARWLGPRREKMASPIARIQLAAYDQEEFGLVGSGVHSRIWLLVHADHRLEQMIKQVQKLEDVLSVRRHGAEHTVFERLEKFFQM